MQHKLIPEELFALCRLLVKSTCAEQFMIQSTLAGLRDKSLLESFVTRMMSNIASLHVDSRSAEAEAADEKLARSPTADDEIDLNKVWFTESTAFKLLSYSKSDELLSDAVLSDNVLNGIVFGIYKANFVFTDSKHVDTAFTLQSRSASIFSDACISSSAYSARDAVLSALFAAIEHASQGLLASKHSDDGNLLCALAKMACIDTQYLLLQQFADAFAEKDYQAYAKLKNAFGKTFKTLIEAGIDVREKNQDGKSFIDMVGEDTVNKLANEKYG